MDTKKITLPEGWEVEKVKGSVIYLKETRNELPKTWEEFCEMYPSKEGEALIDEDGFISIYTSEAPDRNEQYDRNVLSNQTQAYAFRALMQLVRLRDCYRQGWLQSKNDDIKHCIAYNVNEDRIVGSYSNKLNAVLCFQSAEIRDQFMENFKDLIEEAKELI